MKGIFELEEAQEVKGNNIMIVDALNLAFRYKHAKRTSFVNDYYRTVTSLAKSYDAKHVVITCDWGKSSYRKKLYPLYKADREDKVAQQTEEEQQEFLEFFEEFENTMKYCEEFFTVLKYKNVEADDLAAYLSYYTFKDYPGHIWLISSDKDWDLLINDNVSRFSYVTRKEYTKENWEQHYDYPLTSALDVKVLVGGKDNVQGIPGVGEKRAVSLLTQYGSAFDICDNMPIPGTAQYIKNLNEFGENNIHRNYLLIDKVSYCIDAIGWDNIKDIKEKIDEAKIL